ncbi:MAG: hypothetical protein WBW01_01165 [Terriglobales bacterium]
MIDVITSWWRLVRTNCRNVVIVRMWAADLGKAATSPGFDICRSSLRPWRASVQEIFCKAANVAVLIVERRKELLVRGQVPFGAPLQMASK